MKAGEILAVTILSVAIILLALAFTQPARGEDATPDLHIRFADHEQMRGLFERATGEHLTPPTGDADAFCRMVDAKTDHVESYPLGFSFSRGVLCMNKHVDRTLAGNICTTLMMTLASFDEEKQEAVCTLKEV